MRATSIDGLVLIDKPAGISSHDAVALVRRALGTRKVGHGGTLDPFATGLLVMLVGRGTRLLQFVPAEPKVYDATIRFGHETDSDDSTGLTTHSAALPDRVRVREALGAFTGTLQQLPPAYSAKHVNGERAYVVARRGELPELAPVEVQVYGWEVLAQGDDRLHARITCGSGTYIRSLARDLGRQVGSAAHLDTLRRVRVGAFDVSRADDIEALRAGRVRLHALRDALGAMPCQPLDSEGVRRVRQGLQVPSTVDGKRAALVDSMGELVAVARREGDVWHADVVLATA